VKTFFDSSAFAKRFVEEGGSDKVETACTQASELGLSVICVPEIMSALNRRRREKSITKSQYTQAKRSLIEDVSDAEIIHLTHSVIAASITVLEGSPVRAMDALHIACAREWGAELFVSGDKKQLSAARRAGLKSQHV
jgi:predicted nucleic acid-binding protein